MEPRSLQYLADACQGVCLKGRPGMVLERVCTDSRAVRAGDLFIALRGDRFDGHAFVDEAARKGAGAVLIERAKTPSLLPNCGVIVAENTRLALGRMAARYRSEFAIPLIAVAGSNGKTTTKEILAGVLRQRCRALASPASFNNDIGVPTTLLDLSHETEVAVLEFGTNHPGELAPLLGMAQPRYGILTSIGREHLEFFGDLDGVIREEGTLGEYLPKDGKLVLHGDTPGAAEIIRRSLAPAVRVGLGEGNLWRALAIQTEPTGVRFTVQTPLPEFQRAFRLPLLGRHQVVNALLAMAMAAELGASPGQVQDGFDQCAPAKRRLQLRRIGAVQVIDDSYNANADSVRAALDVLQEFPCSGRRIAVLGEMAELGSQAAAAHAEIGRYAVRKGVHRLITVGKLAEVTAGAAREAGLDAAEAFTDLADASVALRREIRADDVILLKASRAAALERLLDLLGSPSEDRER